MKKKTGENITNRSSVISLIQLLFRIWFNNGRLYPEYPEYFFIFFISHGDVVELDGAS